MIRERVIQLPAQRGQRTWRQVAQGCCLQLACVLIVVNIDVFAAFGGYCQEDETVSLISSEVVVDLLTEAQNALLEGRDERAKELYRQAIEEMEAFEPTAEHYRVDAYRLMEEQSLEQALRLAVQACEMAPEDDSVWYCRGQILAQLNRPVEAVDAYHTALTLNSNNNECIRSAWQLFEARMQYQPAVDFFAEFIEANDANDWLYYFQGQALLKNGSPEAAVIVFQRAVELNPNDIDNNNGLLGALSNATELPDQATLGSSGLASFKRSGSMSDQAVAVYASLVDRFPRSIYVKLAHARTLVDAGDTIKAAEILDRLLRSGSLELNHRWNIADLLLEIGEQVDGATGESYCRRAAEQYDRLYLATERGSVDELEAKMDYSRALMGAGDYEAAIRAWQQALRHWRASQTAAPVDIFYEMGLSHFREGNLQAALAYFGVVDDGWGEDSTSMTLERVNLLGYLAEIHTISGDTRSANEQLARLLRTVDAQGTQAVISDRERDEYRLRLATGHMLLDEVAEAITQLRKIRDSESHEVSAKVLLAKAYLRNNQSQLAIDLLRGLETDGSWNDETKTAMGEALIAIGEYREGLTYLESIETTDEGQTSVENLRLQAEAHIALQEFTAARDIFERLLEQKADMVVAWTGLGDLDRAESQQVSGVQRVDRLRQAIDWYEKAQDNAPTSQIIRGKLHATNQEMAAAQADMQAGNERRRTALIVISIVLAALLPGAAMYVGYRRQFARRIFQEVLALERDLKQVIRQQIYLEWHGDWARLGSDDGFSGRFPYKQCLRKLEKSDGTARDVLDVSNFGHLVAIIDCGWTSLGFEQRATPRTRELVIAALSYVGNCRNAIFHSAEIVSESGSVGGIVRSPVKHMDRQVRTSLATIRRNLNLSVVGGRGVTQKSQTPVVTAVKVKESKAAAEEQSTRQPHQPPSQPVPPPFPNVPPPPKQS